MNRALHHGRCTGAGFPQASARLGLSAVVLMLGLAGCSGARPGTPAAVPTFGKSSRLSSEQAADVQFALGRSLEQTDPEQAVAAYSDAVQRDPNRADAWHRLAILHDRQGRPEQSDRCYRRAADLEPHNAALYSDWGYSHYLQESWAEAEAKLRQALSLDPRHRRAHNNLGLVLARTGRRQQALDAFRQGGASEADAQVNLGFALTLDGRWTDARDHFELALAANPGSAVGKTGLKNVHRLENRWPEDGPPVQTAAHSDAEHSVPTIRATEVAQAGLVRPQSAPDDSLRSTPVDPQPYPGRTSSIRFGAEYEPAAVSLPPGRTASNRSVSLD